MTGDQLSFPPLRFRSRSSGRFIFMKFFGLTINLITLFALVLAIGVVVDDAIVVVEAVHAKMAKNI